MNWKNKFGLRAPAPAPDDDFSGGGGGGMDTPGSDGEPSAGGANPEPANHDFSFRDHGSDSSELAEHVGSILDREDKTPGVKLNLQDIGALLKFDAPFKPAVEEPPVDPNAPPVAAPAAVTPPVDPNAPKPLTPEAQAIVEALKAVLPQPAPAPAAPAAPAGPKPRPAFYGDTTKGSMKQALSVNPQLVGRLIGSEDPAAIANAQPALDHLVSGIMNQVMEDSAALMVQMIAQVQQNIPAMVSTQQAAQTNSQKFYDKYKELNQPAFTRVVENIAGAMNAAKAKANGGRPVQIDDKYLDELGTAVHAFLKQNLGFEIPRASAAPVVPAPAPGKAPVAAKPGAPAKKPVFITPGSSRPPAVSSAEQSADLRNFVI